MTITYTLDIQSLDTQTVGENDGRVMRVHWEKTGVDENGITSKCASNTRFPIPEEGLEGSAFTPLAELTEEIVKGWIEDATTEKQEERINGFIISNINEQINPVISAEDLPWA